MLSQRSILLLSISCFLLSGLLLLSIKGSVPYVVDQPIVPPSAPTSDAQLPIRVRIPRLSIDAPIEPVGLTAEGRMDVPKRATDVGWFALGVLPGQKGNAVLAGHLDTVLGTPAVFWDLDKLRVGDELFIEDQSGSVLRFEVVQTAIYDEDKSPMEEIFGPHEKARLQLITCNGVWVKEERNYNKRFVVYTEFTGVEPRNSSVSIDSLQTGL